MFDYLVDYYNVNIVSIKLSFPYTINVVMFCKSSFGICYVFPYKNLNIPHFLKYIHPMHK